MRLLSLLASLSTPASFVAAADKTTETIFFGYRPTFYLNGGVTTATNSLNYASVARVAGPTTVYSLDCAPTTPCYNVSGGYGIIWLTMAPSTVTMEATIARLGEVDEVKPSSIVTYGSAMRTTIETLDCTLEGSTKASCQLSQYRTESRVTVTDAHGSSITEPPASDSTVYTQFYSGDEMWFPEVTVTGGLEKLETTAVQTGGVNSHHGSTMKVTAGIVAAFAAGMLAL